MKILKKIPRAGNFWDLQFRLRRSPHVKLQVVSCCELGFQIDHLFSPIRPTWIGQNAGGCTWQLARESVSLQELVVIHHDRCCFQNPPCPKDSLRTAWQELCQQVERGHHSEDFLVHLWALMGPDQGLKIYHPQKHLLLSPFELD